jgi:hypothetical protein
MVWARIILEVVDMEYQRSSDFLIEVFLWR